MYYQKKKIWFLSLTLGKVVGKFPMLFTAHWTPKFLVCTKSAPDYSYVSV